MRIAPPIETKINWMNIKKSSCSKSRRRRKSKKKRGKRNRWRMSRRRED
jgi:hypothetical protein